jgi:predicted esterase
VSENPESLNTNAMAVGRLVLLFALIAGILFDLRSAFALGESIHVQGGPWMLGGQVFESKNVSAHPHLVIVLHGDAPFVMPTYQYEFARKAAAALNDAVVVGLLRPGYKDGRGGASEGERGLIPGDNYTSDRIASIATAARKLIQSYHARDLTLVGHSGGAIISADLVALYPHLAKQVLLVSCPCNVPAFRRNMLKLQRGPLWLLPVASVSPIENVARIPNDTRVRMVTGNLDPVAPSLLTSEFAGALKQKGGDVKVIVLSGLSHEILLEPEVLEELGRLLD